MSVIIYYFIAVLAINAQCKVVIQENELREVIKNDILIDDIKVDVQRSDTRKHTIFIIPKAEAVDPEENEISNKIDDTQNPKNISESENIIPDTIKKNVEEEATETPPKIDNGTALLLTPFIEEENFEEARNASAVNPDLFLGIKSYSGFLTVNKTYNSNLFFWYFPIAGKAVNETPWIIWLQGGPGATSMTGLFDEIGPFTVDTNENLKLNRFSWARNHSLVFIDNPVGTGYSFTDHKEGFARDMKTYADHLYEAVRQLLLLFPELRTAPLYVAGESYAGKYVPALALELHLHKLAEDLEVNLTGLIIGNAYVDPRMLTNITLPFYYLGLLDQNQIDMIAPLAEAFTDDVTNNRSIAAKNKWNALIGVVVYLSHQKHIYNFLRDEFAIGKYLPYLQKSDVKRALHVGDIPIDFVNMTVNSELAGEFLTSAHPLFETLLDHYRVLSYCGQLDQMLPCMRSSETYRSWRWNGTEEFIKAKRYAYHYNHRLSGYIKTGGHLTEVVIRGAGHMAALDSPGAVEQLVATWTSSDHRLVREVVQDNFIREFIRNNTVGGSEALGFL